jgi:prevent-host-death family protein
MRRLSLRPDYLTNLPTAGVGFTGSRAPLEWPPATGTSPIVRVEGPGTTWTTFMTKPRVRVGVHEARAQLSPLLWLVAAGQEIEILRNGEPVARLVAAGPRAVRQFGTDRGRFDVTKDFDAPAGTDVLEGFTR